MRDWLAEALALPAPVLPRAGMRPYVDKKDIEDKTPPFGTSVHIVHLVPSISEAEPPEAPTPFAAGELGEWQREISRLRPDEPPCPGFRDWPSVHRAAMRFLHNQAGEAIGLGWGVLDLFGVHREVGAVRGDCTGALLGLMGRPVVEITSHLIRFADGLAYRRRPMLAGLTIAVWEFSR